jgi:hypothetical protein
MSVYDKLKELNISLLPIASPVAAKGRSRPQRFWRCAASIWIVR